MDVVAEGLRRDGKDTTMEDISEEIVRNFLE